MTSVNFPIPDPTHLHILPRIIEPPSGDVSPVWKSDFSAGYLHATDPVPPGGTEWNFTFGNGFEFFIRGDVTYQSEMQIEEMNIGQIPARTLVNARIGVAKDGWSADLWGRNIFDERYIANSFFIISGVSYGTSFGEQATYGATMRYRF